MQIADLINSIADRGLELFAFGRGRPLPQDLGGICHALLSERGEASGIALARELVALYRGLDAAGREAFFTLLAREFGPDHAVVAAAARAFVAEPSAAGALALAEAAEPPRRELLRRINMLPEGTEFVIGLRADALDLADEKPELRIVDADLKHVLTDWFSGGFLELRRITWETPAIILEKLIQYEAVHAIPGWEFLRRRLAEDRRCYAFFHPALPNEPVIFVQVALVRGLSGEIAPLLDPEAPVGDPAAADTAIFYSITNTLKGLRGISFGSFLLKQVVADLQQTLPKLATFSTLSPIPGFRRWLETTAPEHQFPAIQAAARDLLSALAAGGIDAVGADKALKPALTGLCARYLAAELRPNGRPIDPVARFHLGNGARLERLNWAGDTAPKGLEQGWGLLVNYLYDPAELERNHEAFVNAGKVATSRAVARQLKPYL
ncbi:malonyl-CoA decarboxylase domain-containing protein [Inquilinus sp. CA228]|uniref:malonyl-CoA decarboxylase domain-containing protein n=1 Tax=Inquilinus sp. CA228 TaxID=3455609 RepID=UPI003F8CF831